jgi:hypothetical protein
MPLMGPIPEGQSFFCPHCGATRGRPIVAIACSGRSLQTGFRLNKRRKKPASCRCSTGCNCGLASGTAEIPARISRDRHRHVWEANAR